MIKHDLGGSLVSDTAVFGPSRFFFTAAAVQLDQLVHRLHPTYLKRINI